MSTGGQRKTLTPVSQRRKTVAACDPCRARKSKCDGALPCKSCSHNKLQCVYDPSTSVNKVAGEFDVLNARLIELERAVFGEITYKTSPLSIESIDKPTPSAEQQQGFETVTALNPRTGSVEFYGSTSIFGFARFLSKRLRELEGKDERRQPKQTRLNEKDSDIEFNRLFEHNAFLPTASQQQTRRLKLREDIANTHIRNYFDNIHDILPILDIDSFMTAYCEFWDASPLTAETVHFQQRQLLVYSVLAMGALYSDTHANNAEWAFSYFVEAQELQGRLFDAVNIETVQAALLMGCYAQHVMRPNVAYNYLGTAIRFAFSIGLNCGCSEPGATNAQKQSAYRTWWALYSAESEQCLDAGRPMSIRETDSTAPYPTEILDPAAGVSRFTYILVMAKFSRITRKIIDLVRSVNEEGSSPQPFAGRLMNHQIELCAWRESLPMQLRFNNEDPGRSQWDTINWVKRQRHNIQVHFNHVLVMMHRPFFEKSQITMGLFSSNMSIPICLGAAQETVMLIHRMLMEDPRMKRWSYYCSYCLAATLILLMRIFDSTVREDAERCADICTMSLEVFQAINTEPAQRCGKYIRDALRTYKRSSQDQDAAEEPEHALIPLDINAQLQNVTVDGDDEAVELIRTIQAPNGGTIDSGKNTFITPELLSTIFSADGYSSSINLDFESLGKNMFME